MNTFKTVAAQGDLRIRRLTDAEAAKLRPHVAERVAPEGGRLILAHSETGHHHVMNADVATLERISAKALPDSITSCLLTVREATPLKHLRDYDTHEPILFEPGVYEVRRQREYTPEGLRQVAD